MAGMFDEPNGTPIASEEQLASMSTITAMGAISTQPSEHNNDNNNNNNRGETSPSTPEETAKEKKYRSRVRAAYMLARETMVEALSDRSLDIYQYCAFLSTNAYHVSPKSAQLVPSASQHGADGVIDQPATSIRSDFPEDKDDNNNNNDTQRSSYLPRESTNRFTQFTTDRLRKAVPRKHRVTKVMYYWAMLKALLVLGLQLTAVIVAMSDLLKEYDVDTDSTLCSERFKFVGTYQGLRKFLFAGFCALLAMTITNVIHDLKASAFYTCLFDNHCLFPDLVDNGWLIAGRTTNYVVLIIITWSSFLIIFFSSRVLDMVVNSAAIFFVLQLDNMVIGTEQRDVVRHYLNVYEWEIEKRVDAFIRKRKRQISEMEQAEANQRKEWNVVKIFFDLISWLLGTAIVSPAVHLTSVLAFVFVPVFMLVCA